MLAKTAERGLRAGARRLHNGYRNTWLTIALAMTATTAAAQSDPAASFYTGRNVSVVIGAGPVGAYADYAHLLVAHMKAHMPGKPTFVFQSMPGAGGIVAANHAFNAAPKDGTHILFAPQNFAVDQAMKTPGVRYDARQFIMIGRFNSNTPIGVGWVPAGITSIDVVRQKEVIAGGTGPGSPTDVLPQLLNAVAGTRYKLISGYKGPNDSLLAMRRGEVLSMVASLTSFQTVFEQPVREGQVVILAQLASRRHPDIPNVPTAGELSLTAEGRSVADLLASGSDVGRMVMAPPGVPKERIEALRAAMVAMLQDPEFKRDAAVRKLSVDYMAPVELEKVVAATLSAPDGVVARARAILESR